MLALLVSQVEPLRVRVLSLVAGREDSSNNFRINVWTSALAMVRDRPWLGIGPGNNAFNLIYPLYQQPKFNALSAYSVPLELLVEAGIPGLLAGLGLLWSSFRVGLSQWMAHGPLVLPGLAAVAVFVGLGVQGLTDTIFFRPEVQLVALFSLATLAASTAPAALRRDQAEAWRRGRWRKQRWLRVGGCWRGSTPARPTPSAAWPTPPRAASWPRRRGPGSPTWPPWEGRSGSPRPSKPAWPGPVSGSGRGSGCGRRRSGPAASSWAAPWRRRANGWRPRPWGWIRPGWW